MQVSQRALSANLRTACRDDATFSRHLLLKHPDGSYVYTAGKMAEIHHGTAFARAYGEAYTVGIDEERKRQIQACASKALKQVRKEKEGVEGGSVAVTGLAFQFGNMGLDSVASHAKAKGGTTVFAPLKTVRDENHRNNKQTENPSSSKLDAVSERTSRTFTKHFNILIQDPHLDEEQKKLMRRFMLNELRSINGIPQSINIIKMLNFFTSEIKKCEEGGRHEQLIERLIQMKKDRFETLFAELLA